MLFKRDKEKNITFEESLEDDWSRDFGVVEVPIGNRPLFYLGVVIVVAGLLLAGRIAYLGIYSGKLYKARAEANVSQEQRIPAPRGLIYDRKGLVLADNSVVFTAFLDVKEFLKRDDLQENTLKAAEDILYLPRADVLSLIKENGIEDFSGLIVLNEALNQGQLVQLKSLNLPTIIVESDFERRYTSGPAFSSVLGYIGRVGPNDLVNNSLLGREDFVGRAGVEMFYNSELSGQPGKIVRLQDSHGKTISEERQSEPQIGKSLHLTVDSDFERYFYERLASGLASLGRRVGIGLAINPQNGEILAMVNLPSFDNNVLSGPGRSGEKAAILNSPYKPLFDRAVSGFYNPGSTIKPLVGVAALKEGIISPQTKVFSPGYIDIPNPYDPEHPSRYLDWRYQGNVDLAAAIAQSSNVYFYTVGGGAESQILSSGGVVEDTGYVKGLGIDRLVNWWNRFNLGKLTGVDLPGEAAGFLPSIHWKENKTGKPWLMGDTYNVSIGQGDLLVTPIQLLDYISAIANGGKIYKPVLNLDAGHSQLADISDLLPQIQEVRKGMLQTVTAQLGTAHLLADLGFSVGAKTGSAQTQNNTQENALFVGYAPADHPQIAVLVLIENSLEGSLNAVPIAKDVLNWYYWNRIKK